MNFGVLMVSKGSIICLYGKDLLVALNLALYKIRT